MNKRLGISLDEKNKAIKEMKMAIRENEDLRMRERYEIILLLLQGYSYEKISEITGLGISTLYSYSKYYREKGVDGLTIGRSPGRKPFLNPAQEQKVFQTIVNLKPIDVGLPLENKWTSPIIREWIEKEFNVSYSERGTRRLLKRLNLSFEKSTYIPTKTDSKNPETFQHNLNTKDLE